MNVRSGLGDHQLVVGCTRDSQIHTGVAAFQLLAAGLFDKLITLAEAKFMAACGVGPAWDMLAAAQPIHGVDENGCPCFVEGGLAIPAAQKAADEAPASLVEALEPKPPTDTVQ